MSSRRQRADYSGPLVSNYEKYLTAMRAASAGRSVLSDYLDAREEADRSFVRWEFNERPVMGDYPFSVANSGGTSASNFARVVGAFGGAIQGDTGTTDNGSVSLVGDLEYYGDQNAGLAIRWYVDVVTSVNVECGFIDSVPGANDAWVTDIDVPTITDGDAAVFSLDTDQTASGLHFATSGSVVGMDDTTTSVPGSLTAATYCLMVVQLVGNAAYGLFGANPNTLELVAKHDNLASGNLEGGTVLAPWFYCRTRNTTAKFPRIDYIEVWTDRP